MRSVVSICTHLAGNALGRRLRRCVKAGDAVSATCQARRSGERTWDKTRDANVEPRCAIAASAGEATLVVVNHRGCCRIDAIPFGVPNAARLDLVSSRLVTSAGHSDGATTVTPRKATPFAGLYIVAATSPANIKATPH